MVEGHICFKRITYEGCDLDMFDMAYGLDIIMGTGLSMWETA